MADCPEAPNVNNALISTINKTNTITAIYECLSGFVISGDQRILCDKSNGTWPEAPTCSVIQANTYIYTSSLAGGSGEWWPYFMAAFLVLFLMLLIVALVLCFCCPPCRHWIYRAQEPATPWIYQTPPRDTRDEILSDRSEKRKRDSVFWVDKISETGEPCNVSEVSETPRRESQIYRNPPPPARDLIKEGKWLPHRNSIRDINTSTK